MTTLGHEIDRARAILHDAIAEHQPVAVFGAFSGGNDSIVVTHFACSEVKGCRALHINTGIGIPATREHAREVAADRGWNLWEEATPISYDDLVLGRIKGYMGGFPGPAMHRVMYRELKERAIRAVVRKCKEGRARTGRVMLVSGIRHDESQVRSGKKEVVFRVDAITWVNPFYHATYDHFAEYRQRFDLPRNPVKDQVGISGECLCGSFASPGELCLIRKACPKTAGQIESLEHRARAAGFLWGWGERPPQWWLDERRGQGLLFPLAPPVGPMCNSCEKGGNMADHSEQTAGATP